MSARLVWIWICLASIQKTLVVRWYVDAPFPLGTVLQKGGVSICALKNIT